jgi:hypothetical protein
VQSVGGNFEEAPAFGFNATSGDPGRCGIRLETGVVVAAGQARAHGTLAGADLQYRRPWRYVREGTADEVVAEPCVQRKRRKSGHALKMEVYLDSIWISVSLAGHTIVSDQSSTGFSLGIVEPRPL